jgi:hypothetical protein
MANLKNYKRMKIRLNDTIPYSIFPKTFASVSVAVCRICCPSVRPGWTLPTIPTPKKATLPHIYKEDRENQNLYPPPEVMERLFFLKNRVEI